MREARRPMRVCLISSIHPWVNPRLVKEADLLAALGHDVTVVTKRVDRWSDERDAGLLPHKRWRADRVNLRRDDPQARWAWLRTAVRSRVAFTVYRATGGLRCAEEAYYRGFGEVLAAAIRTRADFFIAHTQGALPIAARAAARRRVPYGFDCEDLLAEEAADGLRDSLRRRAILDIERAYLPGAAYVLATSQVMAQYLASEYGITPHVVRNVFPLAELDGIAAPSQRPRSSLVELVWMSATIGPGRGLEDAIRALARLPREARLTLFGRMLPAYAPTFSALVDRLALGDRVIVRPIPEPHAVMSTIAQFDIGLSLDLNDCVNRSLTICNKVFLYLQGGLVVATTDTPGQREVIESVGQAGFVYPPGDDARLAAELLPYVTDPARLLAARETAWRAGRERYNWDRESDTFLAALGEDHAASAGRAIVAR